MEAPVQQERKTPPGSMDHPKGTETRPVRFVVAKHSTIPASCVRTKRPIAILYSAHFTFITRCTPLDDLQTTLIPHATHIHDTHSPTAIDLHHARPERDLRAVGTCNVRGSCCGRNAVQRNEPLPEGVPVLLRVRILPEGRILPWWLQPPQYEDRRSDYEV